MKAFPIPACGSALGLALLASPAAAVQFTPVSQARTLTVDVSANNMGAPPTTDHQALQAPDFSPFDEMLQASVTGTHGAAQGFATQTSSIGSETVSATGSGSGTSSAPQLEPDAGALATARSEFEFVFDVQTDSHFNATGVCRAVGDSPFGAVSLTGPDGLIFGVFPSGLQDVLPVDASGILSPGRYTLLCVAEGFDFSGIFYGFSGQASFEVEFTVDATPAEAFCLSQPNSAATSAQMGWGGGLSLLGNAFELEASGVVPGVQGLFFYGSAPIQAPFGDGFRCVGGSVHRLQRPVQASPAGVATYDVDFTASPASPGSPGAIEPGSTWYFQFWYRDLAAGGSGFNLSDGLSATFLP